MKLMIRNVTNRSFFYTEEYWKATLSLECGHRVVYTRDHELEGLRESMEKQESWHCDECYKNHVYS